MQWVQSQHVWNPDLIRVVTYRRPHYQVIPPADAFYCRSQVWLNPQLCSTLRRNPYLSIIQNRTRTFWHNISADEHHVDLSKDPTKRTEEPVRLAVLLMTSHSCLVNQIVLFLGEGGPKDLHTLISVHSFKSVQINISTQFSFRVYRIYFSISILHPIHQLRSLWYQTPPWDPTDGSTVYEKFLGSPRSRVSTGAVWNQ